MIVVNDSAMISARLHASCSAGRLVLRLAADLGPGLALVERRDPAGEPDWAPFAAGDRIVLTDREGRELSRGTVAGRFHPQSRLWLVNTQDPWYQVAAVSGSPVRYGYVGRPYPLSDYQSVFGCRPGSSNAFGLPAFHAKSGSRSAPNGGGVWLPHPSHQPVQP